MKIQFITGHKNIEGNELADLAAKAGHNLSDITLEAGVYKEDMVREVRASLMRFWDNSWHQEVESSDKGRHLMSIKGHVQYWPWSSCKLRTVETTLARLRIGHVGVGQHLHRFHLAETNLCQCGEIDSIVHFLLQCPLYAMARTELQETLHDFGVSITVQNLCGGGDFPPPVQFAIVSAFTKYLLHTGRLKEM